MPNLGSRVCVVRVWICPPVRRRVAPRYAVWAAVGAVSVCCCARLPFWLRSHFACLFSCLTSVCEFYLLSLLFCPLCARSLCCCSLCLLLLSLVFRLLNPLVVVVVYSAIKPVYPSSGLVGTFKSIINLNPHKLVSTLSSCVTGFSCC